MHAPVSFPDVIGLSPWEVGSASRFIHNATFRGNDFRGCRHFVMFRPPSLFASQVAPTATALPQGSRGFYVRAERASLPSHAPDILAVRRQAIDGARTYTLLDSQHCRLLPPQIVPTAASFPRSAAETFTSEQNVRRCLRTHRTCYPPNYRQLAERGLPPRKIRSFVGCSRMMPTFPPSPLSVGSRSGAVSLRSRLPGAPRFLWEWTH